MEISNKTIIFLLLVAIAISLFGTFLSLVKITGWAPSITGFGVTDTGVGMINLTIDRVVDINWTVTNITWGEGSINPGYPNCSLYTNGTANSAGCTGFADFSTGTQPMIIENIGNVNATLNFSFDVNAATFIGGVSPAFAFMTNESEHGSCTNTTGEEGADERYGVQAIYYVDYEDSPGEGQRHNNTPDNWVDVNISTTEEFMICPRFEYKDANDSINVWFYVVLPGDSTSGNLSATLTASASLMDPYGS